MDVTEVALHQVTDDFIGHIRAMGSNWDLDQGRSVSGVTADKAGALYNYMLLARGSGKVAHNPKYCRQLFWDSMIALTGANPTTLNVRP